MKQNKREHSAEQGLERPVDESEPTRNGLGEPLDDGKMEDPARDPSHALKLESERALVEQIHRLLALPPNKRTNFLRVRLPGGGSAL